MSGVEEKQDDIEGANNAIARPDQAGAAERRPDAASRLSPAKEQNAAIAHTGAAVSGAGETGGSNETADALKRAAENDRRV